MGTLTTGNIKAGALGSSNSPAPNTFVSFANSTVTTLGSTDYTTGGQEIKTFDFSENGLSSGEAFVYEKSTKGGIQGYPGLCIVSDQVNGSQVFVDRSPSNHPISAVADVHHDSGGGVTLYNDTSIFFDGTGDALSIAHHDDFAFFGYEDFTIDFWIYPDGTPTDNDMICQCYDPSTGIFYDDWSMAWGPTRIEWGHRIGNVTKWRFSCTYTWTASAWHHVVVQRQGPRQRFWINGIELVAEVAGSGWDTNSTAFFSKIPNDAALTIGWGYYASRMLDAYIDDFRILKGVALYDKNFNPPSKSPTGTTGYGNSSEYTKIMMVGYRVDSSSVGGTSSPRYFTAINYVAGDEIVAKDYMGITEDLLQGDAHNGDTQKIMIYNNTSDTIKFTAYVEATT